MASDILLVIVFGGTGGGAGEPKWGLKSSCRGDVDVSQRGEWPGDGVPWRGGTESGEGLFRTAFVRDKAGFNGGGGGGLAVPKGVDFARNAPFGFTVPPENLARASCMDDNRVFEPNVGVPHLELARSMISMSLWRFLSSYAELGASYFA